MWTWPGSWEREFNGDVYYSYRVITKVTIEAYDIHVDVEYTEREPPIVELAHGVRHVQERGPLCVLI